MSDALAISLAKIFGSVVLLGFVLWGVSRLSKLARLDAEVGRKMVHISLGLYCLTFPWIFVHAWEVGATCALAIAVFMLARGLMRQSLGGGLHAIQRTSYGELFFAVSVALLFWLMGGHYIMSVQSKPPMGKALYILPILILTLCDAASALVGSRYGRRTFRIEEGSKSVEGVIVFAVTAWLVSLIALLLLTDIGRGEVILLAFITAVFGALLEAASWRGLDNLFIPLGLYFLLANLLYLGVGMLAVIAGAFFLTLIALLWATRHEAGPARHFLAIGATLFFCIWIFSGAASLIAPGLAVAMYFICQWSMEPERPQFDALNLLLVVLAVALCFFLVSNMLRTDTIFAYNVAFASLAAAIVGRFKAPWIAVLGAIVLAFVAMTIRVVWIEGPSETTWRFAALGLAGIVIAAAAARGFSGWSLKHPWATLGGLSMLIGFATLPASPT